MRAVLLSAVLIAGCCRAQTPIDWIASDSVKIPGPQMQAFLKAICSGGTTANGCLGCPHGLTGGDAWEVRAVYLGHFVSSSSEDALVRGFGCEPHASGYGGSFLFTRDGAAWGFLRYSEGMIAWDCKKLVASDGRDRLVCAGAGGHQGVSGSFLYLLDPLHEAETFFNVVDTTGALLMPDGMIESDSIKQVEFTQLPESNHIRILVVAEMGKAEVPANFGRGDGPAVTIATERREYRFVFDGEKVTPAEDNPPMEAPVTSYSVRK